MTNQTSQSVVKGALILTFAGLISKILSAGYRVPLQNITGDLGFYVYQQVYPILGVALILSLYGFPAAISKLVSEFMEEKSFLSLPSFYLPVFSWLMGICGLIFVIGFTQAPAIAAVMGDEKLIPSLRSAFFVFLLVPFISLFRGVFQGMNQMKPTAVSQILDQLIRVSTIIATAVLVIKFDRLYVVGIGASVASFLGACGGLGVLLFFVKKQSIWKNERWSTSVSYIRTILFYGLFICLNYTLLLSMQFVDSLSLVPGLLEFGVEMEKARVLKGVFDRGQPLIQLGTVLASSVALALIPSVTRKRYEKDPEHVKTYMYNSTKISLIISLGATAGLIVLFPEINQLFFQNTQGTNALRVLMLVILFASLSLTTASVLQGLGYVRHTATLILLAIGIKVFGNYWLIPAFGLHGAAVASTIATAFVLAGNIVLLGKEIPLNRWLNMPWLKIGASLTGMILFLTLFHDFGERIMADGRVLLLIYTLTMTTLGGLVYFLLLLTLGTFTKKELEPMPFYNTLQRLLPKGLKS
ncbi:putative polysaccharide biosynthesis protein [Halobacillus mangrovi]|uniref:Polysaccharide biosynthesis protein n=1 Tax=Halobacillus mangrovi TaxID=402384 RepID=A0A1W5ZQ99_9BACI|nr:polysaccharide biosynthesis protein [Halobacillus mangrovi]ARI75451.1 polysaccharide biosynthesis protein [Halobacillus mangrovi]